MIFRVASMQRAATAALTILPVLPASAGSKKCAGGSLLEGRGYGPGGEAIRGAVVGVRALEGDKSWASEPSDRRGSFSLQQLPYGWVDLIVTTEKGDFLGDQAVNLP